MSDFQLAANSSSSSLFSYIQISHAHAVGKREGGLQYNANTDTWQYTYCILPKLKLKKGGGESVQSSIKRYFNHFQIIQINKK